MTKNSIRKCIMGVCLCMLLVFGTGCSSSKGESDGYEYTGYVMGTVLNETIYSSGDDITKDVEDKLSELETNLISWRKKNSEIAKINASAGKSGVKVSDETADCLRSALKMAKASDGAFDPTIGKITRLWGFDGEDPKKPADSKIQKLLADVGYQNVEIDGNTVKLAADTSLDLGAAGKGLGCDKIKDMFDENGKVSGAVITIGGSSIMTYGSKPDGSKWKVAITDPRSDGDYLGTITVEGTTYISTSGDYEKYFMKDGVRYHHILDPKTGYSARSGLMSVTVVCDSGIESDMLATACFVLGKDKGMKLAKKYNAAAIFVDEDKNVYVNDKASKMFKLTQDGYSIAE